MLWRRLRGLAGTALTWGVVGAVVALPLFFLRFHTWPVDANQWSRLIRLLGMWETAGLLWGAASGLAFGLAILAAERSRRFGQLSARRMTLWGAAAGAAFPLALFVRPLLAGYGSAWWFFLMLAGGSAVAGAACARVIFGLARRGSGTEDESPAAPPSLVAAPPLFSDLAVPVFRERVR